MAATYAIHRDLGVVVTRYSGEVTDDEFVGLYDALYRDPEYSLGTDELADVRGVDRLNLSAAALRRVEQMTRSRYGDSDENFRTAIIAPGDLSYGIGRMYGVFAEDGPENVKVCREPAEALEWLGLASDALDL